MNILRIKADEYHAIEAVSNSLISKILKSPAHARAYLDKQPVATKAMEFGTAFHVAILEPKKFAEQYVVFNGDRRTKEGKATYEELTCSGKQILSTEDMEDIHGMQLSVFSHNAAKKLIEEGHAELSVTWDDYDTMVKCKCRPDWWNGDVLVDIKTTDDASPEGFMRAIVKYGYHRQAAWYLRGTEAKKFIFIAVEKQDPYAVGVYELDALSLSQGSYECDRALQIWANANATGEFRAYSDECELLSLPDWKFDEQEITV
jgi:exodeoxyribonuclease VIII